MSDPVPTLVHLSTQDDPSHSGGGIRHTLIFTLSDGRRLSLTMGRSSFNSLASYMAEVMVSGVDHA